MRVTLVQCPVWGTREPPLSIVQLSGCLKAAGHEVFSFDLNNELYRSRAAEFANLWTWEQSLFWYDARKVGELFGTLRPRIEAAAAKVLERRPRAVGFSVAASSYAASKAFAEVLRGKDPELVIVFGGTLFYDARYVAPAFNEAKVDYVIRGEGDVTIPALVTALERGEDAASCPGVYLRRNGEIFHTGERAPLKDLDSLPYMDFTDLRIRDYDDDEHIAIMSSRGCVWHCAFCSSSSFWPGYRSMSAERIHQEITFHRMANRKIGHVDFFDLAFNGDMKKVEEFSRLMVMYPPFDPNFRFEWNANAIITPKLTPAVLKLMKAAGCQRLIFGIESGSEKVLKLMHKPYDPEVAVRVIKDAHDAGIKVTCNFMFGFPGETEDDFEKTLDFVRCIAPHVERLYPSRTYCAIEENSYFHDHPSEFNIKTPFNHHLYWETTDGENTYPVRLARCRRFEELCAQLGVRIDCGVQSSVELENWFSLGMYYEYKSDYDKVLECYRNYLRLDPKNAVVIERVKALLERPETRARWERSFTEYMGHHG